MGVVAATIGVMSYLRSWTTLNMLGSISPESSTGFPRTVVGSSPTTTPDAAPVATFVERLCRRETNRLLEV